VAGRIDDVDLVVFPGGRRGSGIVMPRSRSCAIQSMTAVPASTSPILYVIPV